MFQRTESVERWASQLDGRLIYQHAMIFEPELTARHYERMARLSQAGALATRARQLLGKNDLAARATAFILEHSSFEDANRLFFDSALDALARANGPLVFGCDGGRLTVLSGKTTIVLEALADLRAYRLDFIPALVAGAYVLVAEESLPALPPAFSSKEGACAGLCIIPQIAQVSADSIIRGSAQILIDAWDLLETEALSKAGYSMKNSPNVGMRFASFVHAEFIRRRDGRRPECSYETGIVVTPFCKDALLAWAPRDDRMSSIIGARVNHFTSLADILTMGRSFQ